MVQDEIYPQELEGYNIIHEIGGTKDSTVYSATIESRGDEVVAIKMIDIDSLEETTKSGKKLSFSSTLKAVFHDVKIMKQCNHPNVAKVYAAFVHENQLCIVMELFEGSIQGILNRSYPHGLDSEEVIASVLKQVLLGLNYLHKNELVHRDLKGSNIMIHRDGTIKLSDFGLSSEMNQGGEQKKVCHTFVGSAHYMAPEVMGQTGEGYGPPADIWSFGITAIELAEGSTPTENLPELKVYINRMEGPSPSLDDPDAKFSKNFKEMIDCCLDKDPNNRHKASKLLKHNFFKIAKSADFVASNLKIVPKKKALLENCQIIRKNGKWEFDPPIPDKLLQKLKNGATYLSRDDRDNLSLVVGAILHQFQDHPKAEEIKKIVQDLGATTQHKICLALKNDLNSILSQYTNGNEETPPSSAEGKWIFEKKKEANGDEDLLNFTDHPIVESKREKIGRFVIEDVDDEDISNKERDFEISDADPSEIHEDINLSDAGDKPVLSEIFYQNVEQLKERVEYLNKKVSTLEESNQKLKDDYESRFKQQEKLIRSLSEQQSAILNSLVAQGQEKNTPQLKEPSQSTGRFMKMIQDYDQWVQNMSNRNTELEKQNKDLNNQLAKRNSVSVPSKPLSGRMNGSPKSYSSQKLVQTSSGKKTLEELIAENANQALQL